MIRESADQERLLRYSWGMAILLFVIQFAPYVLRPDAYIRIHDTLEGEWMWYYAIVQSGKALSFDMNAVIDAWFGGVPRYLFPTGFSMTTLLICIFGPVNGYLVSSLLIDVIGFTGCYFLFRGYIFTRRGEAHWPVLIAALYSIIPFFATFGISLSGLPLLLLAFLNILTGRSRFWEYGFIIIFPFYSNIVWSAPFVNAMLLAAFLAMWKQARRVLPYFGMILLMDMLYLAANYHLVYAMAFSDIALQRDSYAPLVSHSRSQVKSIGETAYLFLANHYHVGTMVNLGILLLAICAWSDRTVRRLTGIALAIALLNGFYLYIVPVLKDIHPLLISFRISRVKILLPFLWMLILAFSIRALLAEAVSRRLSYFVIGTTIVSTLFANDEILNNYRNWFGADRKPDAREFYAAATWTEIEKVIGRDKKDYIVAHLGLNPAISQYNGFRAIDGLQAMYPLEHKEFMMEVMRGELAKDEKLVRYFSAWGNRCYFFSSELGKEHAAFMIDKTMKVAVNDWSIDTELLRSAGVEYIFSSVGIGNAGALGLEPAATVELPDGFWKIHVYQLQNTEANE